MQAHTPVDLEAKINSTTEYELKEFQEKLIAREQSRKFAPLFRRLSFFYGTTLYTFDKTPIIEIAVDNMKDCEPALAMIEDECGVVFDKTFDNVTVRERQFSANGLGFRLDVRVKHDSPTCREVLVGYEQVPKYELRCDEDTPTTEPKKEADDGIPF